MCPYSNHMCVSVGFFSLGFISIQRHSYRRFNPLFQFHLAKKQDSVDVCFLCCWLQVIGYRCKTIYLRRSRYTDGRISIIIPSGKRSLRIGLIKTVGLMSAYGSNLCILQIPPCPLKKVLDQETQTVPVYFTKPDNICTTYLWYNIGHCL